jgi:hypothetical protein
VPLKSLVPLKTAIAGGLNRFNVLFSHQPTSRTFRLRQWQVTCSSAIAHHLRSTICNGLGFPANVCKCPLEIPNQIESEQSEAMFVPDLQKESKKVCGTLSVCESLQLFHLKPLRFIRRFLQPTDRDKPSTSKHTWQSQMRSCFPSLTSIFKILGIGDVSHYRYEKVVEPYHFLGIQWHDSRVD